MEETQRRSNAAAVQQKKKKKTKKSWLKESSVAERSKQRKQRQGKTQRLQELSVETFACFSTRASLSLYLGGKRRKRMKMH